MTGQHTTAMKTLKRVVDAYMNHLDEWIRKYIAPEEEIKKLKQKSGNKEKPKQSNQKNRIHNQRNPPRLKKSPLKLLL